MRFEGESNIEWTVTYSDNTTEKFVGYDEAPRNTYDDSKVHSYNPELDEALDQLREICDQSISWNPEELETLECTVDLVNRKILNINVCTSDDYENPTTFYGDINF